MEEKRLVRVEDDKMLFGVASGLAYYVGVDPVIVRLLFVLLTLWTGGTGLLLYGILILLMPEDRPDIFAKAHSFDEDEIIIQDVK